MKYSKEKVNLCKEIAKYYKKPIYYGDWYWDVSLEHDENPLSLHKDFTLEKEDISEEIIPIWTIQDCLYILEEKGSTEYIIKLDELNILWKLFLIIGNEDYICDGNTILEAFLKAVLKIVKEREDE